MDKSLSLANVDQSAFSIAYAKDELPEFIKKWAQQVGIKITRPIGNSTYYLKYEDEKLKLAWTAKQRFSDIFVKLPERKRNDSRNLLLKAIGKGHYTIGDLTAGLGVDAFTMAVRGHVVHCVERCPPIALLFYDALARVDKNINQSVHLNFAEAIDWLAETSVDLDILYIDAMFEKTKKSAKPVKSMQILRSLVGNDEDVEDLLYKALQREGIKKVIVKSADKSKLIMAKPHSQYRGKTVRFDVYRP